MHFLFFDVTWECLINVLKFFCGVMSFYVSISNAVFLVTSFSILDHSVWLILSFRCANLFISTGVVVVALANLSWSVFLSIMC